MQLQSFLSYVYISLDSHVRLGVEQNSTVETFPPIITCVTQSFCNTKFYFADSDTEVLDL